MNENEGNRFQQLTKTQTSNKKIISFTCTLSQPMHWSIIIDFKAYNKVIKEWKRCKQFGHLTADSQPLATHWYISSKMKQRLSQMSQQWFVVITTKVLALTTSSIVTPKTRFGSKTPAFLKTSAAIGTVELTGLLIMLTIAFGQHLAIASQRVLTIPALMLKRSSLVIPGFLGTPAGMITRSIPIRASSNCCCPKNPRTYKSQNSLSSFAQIQETAYLFEVWSCQPRQVKDEPSLKGFEQSLI